MGKNKQIEEKYNEKEQELEIDMETRSFTCSGIP